MTLDSFFIPTDDQKIANHISQILEDWASKLLLDPQEIDSKRATFIEKWRKRRGANQCTCVQANPVLLKDSGYLKRLPIGTLQSLEWFYHEL